MKITKKAKAKNPSPNTHRLTNQDCLELVQCLIKETRRKKRTVNALTCWLCAFTIFKQMRNRFGLPEVSDRKRQLALILNLRTLGHRIAQDAANNDIDLEKEAETRPSAFQACLEILKLETGIIELEKKPEIIAMLDRKFGVH
jgi:hypothetical protein